jgi:hypothetical protein
VDDLLPLESLRKLAQFTPHFRIASLAVLLSACLSPARDLSVDRKELGLEGVLVLLELLLGVGVAVLEGPSEESMDCDLRSLFDECDDDDRCADCGERCVF